MNFSNTLRTVGVIVTALIGLMAVVAGCTADDPSTIMVEATKCTATWLTPEFMGIAVMVMSGLELIAKAIRPGGMLGGLFGQTAIVSSTGKIGTAAMVVPANEAGAGVVTPAQVQANK